MPASPPPPATLPATLPAFVGRQPIFDGRMGLVGYELLFREDEANVAPPCVDGDYDMSVIAHEYGHLVSNRMVAGPNANLSGNQAQAMGESWSDLQATEFLNSQALVPIGGAVIGGVAGNAAGKAVGTQRGYAYIVRFDNGEVKEIIQGADLYIQPGTPVSAIAGADGWKLIPR